MKAPLVSGSVDSTTGQIDHLVELRNDPISLLHRVRSECGDVGRFRLAGRDVILLSDSAANEFFFRSAEEDLDQAQAYPFMKPIFGEGVVFDASPERRREMLHNQSLRDKYMRGHAQTIEREVVDMVAQWNESGGEIDLLEWFAELTIYTSSACLVGKRFRDQLDSRFAKLYHDLERGTDAVAFVDPYADIESFHKRDQARLEIVGLVTDIMATREDQVGDEVSPDQRDLLDVLMSIRNPDGSSRFTPDEVTGMFISMMFAGHHTTSGTAAWTLIELLRNPRWMSAVVDELDSLFANGEEVSYQALRSAPVLEAAIKEALRLHPPLILLLRVVKTPQEVLGFKLDPGVLVGASPRVSNRIEHSFADHDSFDPGRYLNGRADDSDNPWNWIPFGAGRHRCVGAAFAMMQLKAIFMVLLRDWSFTASQLLDSYRDDLSKMVIQLAQPATVAYQRRGLADDVAAAQATSVGDTLGGASAAGGSVRRIVVDLELCQGHGVCESEAPNVFAVNRNYKVEVAQAQVDLDDPATLETVEKAVRYCPTRAIGLL